MNLIGIEPGLYAISFNDIDLDINGLIYSNLIFLVRLLTPNELMRVLGSATDNPSLETLLEEDVFHLIFKSIVGIDEEIDIENIEAGVITTIVDTVIEKSLYFFKHPIDALNEEELQVNMIEQMQLIVARFFSIPFSEVEKLPLDSLYKKYAIFSKTFPTEALNIKANEDI